MAPAQARERVEVIARQAAVSMVLAARLLAGGPQHTVDHPIRDPVPQRLRAMLVDEALHGFQGHLVSDSTRHCRQGMTIDIRRHGRISRAPRPSTASTIYPPSM